MKNVLRLPPPLAPRPWSLHWLQYELKEAHGGTRARGVVCNEYRGPWKLIYYEAYIDRHDAEGRERYLKSGSGRRFLRQQLRPLLRDISS